MSDETTDDVLDMVRPTTTLSSITSTQPTSDDVDPDIVKEGRCRIAPRPQMMLAIRSVDGRVEALPYSTLMRIIGETASRITLQFHHAVVAIHGERLTRLFHYLCAHRVMEIVQSDRCDIFTNQDEFIVTSVEVQPATRV